MSTTYPPQVDFSLTSAQEAILRDCEILRSRTSCLQDEIENDADLGRDTSALELERDEYLSEMDEYLAMVRVDARETHERFLSFHDRHRDGYGCEEQLAGLFSDAVRAAAFRNAVESII